MGFDSILGAKEAHRAANVAMVGDSGGRTKQTRQAKR